MEVDFASAMQQLEAMFPNFDDETFRTVLTSNDGHLERTIEDLIKLSNEVENGPDDDENLFAEPSRKNASNRYSEPTYQANRSARDHQESDDAKMAYELQMQYMQENQNAGGSRNHHDYNTNNPYPSNQSYSSQNVAGSYDGVQGFHPVSAPTNDSGKKKGFMKKLKLAVKNLVTRKGKGGKKGPTRNPGMYAEMDENLNPNNQLEDEPDLFKVKEDENDAPMKLSDVMNRKYNEEDAGGYDPRDEYINQRSYDNNENRYADNNRHDNDRYGDTRSGGDRYGNHRRDEYPREAYPVHRNTQNYYYSDNYYEQH